MRVSLGQTHGNNRRPGREDTATTTTATTKQRGNQVREALWALRSPASIFEPLSLNMGLATAASSRTCRSCAASRPEACHGIWGDLGLRASGVGWEGEPWVVRLTHSHLRQTDALAKGRHHRTHDHIDHQLIEWAREAAWSAGTREWLAATRCSCQRGRRDVCATQEGREVVYLDGAPSCECLRRRGQSGRTPCPSPRGPLRMS